MSKQTVILTEKGYYSTNEKGELSFHSDHNKASFISEEDYPQVADWIYRSKAKVIKAVTYEGYPSLAKFCKDFKISTPSSPPACEENSVASTNGRWKTMESKFNHGHFQIIIDELETLKQNYPPKDK
jgi:hypothetical protein